MIGSTLSDAVKSFTLASYPARPERTEDCYWHPVMHWAIPKHKKKRVNWAGQMLLVESPPFNFDSLIMMSTKLGIKNMLQLSI